MMDEADVLEDLDQLRSRYDVLGHLGHDGEFVVYRARTLGTDRHVAVKLTGEPGSRSTRPDTLFGWQAHTVKPLEHPNLLALHAVHHLQGGAVALAMERWHGRTLAERIEREGALDAGEVERILRDVAGALAYLHARGVVHRGVRPHSIFIDPESGEATLAHFAIDKGDRQEVGPDAATSAVVRSFAYLAPEQIAGRSRVDGRGLGAASDLYSLGLVGYAMLTGGPAWDGADLGGLIERRRVDSLPSLAGVRPEVPARLRVAIEGCLQASPRRRWKSAEDLLALLDTEVAEQPTAPGLGRGRLAARIADGAATLRAAPGLLPPLERRGKLALGAAVPVAGVLILAVLAGGGEPTATATGAGNTARDHPADERIETAEGRRPTGRSMAEEEAGRAFIIPDSAAASERTAVDAAHAATTSATSQATRVRPQPSPTRERRAPLLGDTVRTGGLVLLGEPIRQ